VYLAAVSEPGSAVAWSRGRCRRGGRGSSAAAVCRTPLGGLERTRASACGLPDSAERVVCESLSRRSASFQGESGGCDESYSRSYASYALSSSQRQEVAQPSASRCLWRLGGGHVCFVPVDERDPDTW